jgi:hypothetical protein
MRIDGELTFTTDQNTQLHLETLIVGRGGVLRIATTANRLPVQYTAEIIIADSDYAADSRIATGISLSRWTRLWGRGVIWLGEFSAWGHLRTRWLRTALASAPMATDTSATLAEPPVGWQVGDQIVIAGTLSKVAVPESQTEYRTITAISGATISWSDGLAFDHGHAQSSTVIRDDLQPVIGNTTSNIIIRSKYNRPKELSHLRGHTMAMHKDSKTDLWDVAFYDLGRTRKEPGGPAGNLTETNAFRYYDEDTDAFIEESLTPSSNVQRKYPIHAHFVGFNKDVVYTFNSCVRKGSHG